MQEKTDIYATSSLPDKAPGIYETLGPNEMLLSIVQSAGKTAGTASDIASAFAGLLLNPNDHDLQHGIRMSWLSNELNHLCESVGELLACYILGSLLIRVLPRITFFRALIPEERLSRVAA